MRWKPELAWAKKSSAFVADAYFYLI